MDSTPQQETQITIRLGNGLPLQVDREAWRTEILPANPKAAWDEPRELANLIMDRSAQRRYRAVLEASKHLFEIDDEPVRGTALYSQDQIHNGAAPNAGKLLEDHIKAHGRSAVILVNQAQVAAQKAGTETEPEVSELLWEALELEPN